ncbi:hypothetical protein HO950_04765 [Streptococcus suis]|uniref:hypothetical protein n=1 Tax=Streptococcus suis TaxID=1307 RepID=UPI00155465E1|nr:hypothetical protein [Streptococcus suis]NQG97264.1 hypothetical protein [Streptococcus suis]NQO82479.1 hypothetical protein [Streptococcus suis]NQO84377.1 hypothetical protein [Streptococcus suis]HEL1838093.1 hypothetical protein [Streptococcus suis]
MIWLIKLLLIVVISIPVTSILQPLHNHYLNGVTVAVISVIVSHLVDKYGKGGDEV